ncbi:MAG: hypothetical protein KF700_02895 [Hyphomonadaceae bacterium]|nr:hypothetical protein [Hyphomonadaceae bacterium]
MSEPVTAFDQTLHGWRAYALVALIALVSATFGAARSPVLDPEEARFAQTSRQMAETGDGARARFQGETTATAALGVHWLQADAARATLPMTQKLNAIWPYRLPSALGLVVAALATLWGGAALIGRRAALLGASLFAAGMLAGFEGMSANAGAVLLGFTTLALAAAARLRAPSAPRPLVHALIFWAALAGALLANGLLGPLIIALTLSALALWERDAQWAARLLMRGAPLIAPAIIVACFAFAGVSWTDALRSLASWPAGSSQTSAPLPGFHLFLLPFLIFPATYALPAAARLIWETTRAPRKDDAHAGMRLLICWAAPALLAVELLAVRWPDDALLAYPALALMCGAGLAAMRGRPWRTAHPAGLVLFGFAGAVVVTITAATATFMPGDFTTDIRRAASAALIGLGIVGAALAALLMLRQPTARAAVLVACALVLSFSLRERLLPEARELHVSSEITAALTRARLMPREGRSLWVVGYRGPSLVFLTRTDIQIVDTESAATQAARGDALVVEGTRLEEMRARLAQRGLAFVPSEPAIRGLSLAHGERVVLFVGPVSDAAAAGQLQNP